MALSKQHWVSFQTWRLPKNIPKTQVANGMRNPDSESPWKGREHHRAVLSCFFASSCSDLTISQICPQGRSWQGGCLTLLRRQLGRQPKAKPGQSGLLPVPATLYQNHHLKDSSHHTGDGWDSDGNHILTSCPRPQQGLSAALICCLLKTPHCLACQGNCELTLQGSWGKEHMAAQHRSSTHLYWAPESRR